MTSLLGGELVSKEHPRLEAYGTLDELNAWIGLLRDHLEEYAADLQQIQDRIMAGAGLLAAGNAVEDLKIPKIREQDITLLENRIDALENELPALRSFLLPGGHPQVSFCHLARTVCRRAERLAAGYIKSSEQAALLVKYLNRLSDYLFILARKIAADFNVEEIPWEPES